MKKENMKKFILLFITIITIGCSSSDTQNCDCNKVISTTSDSFTTKNECDDTENTFINGIWGNQPLNTCFSPEQLEQVDNSNIPYRNVNLTINFTLPAYSSVQFPGYYVIIDNIIIYNNGYKYRAYDMRSPNNPQILLTITQPGGFGNNVSSNAICPETGKVYLLGIGSTINLDSKLKEYNVISNENSISVSN